MAESSRMSLRLLSHATPNAERIEKMAAVSRGERPVYRPIPTPPKEACVIPPLIKTSRRVTMYVPMMTHAMLAKRLPSRAFWKKVY